MKISAVIFDLDGTVLDNEYQYGLAFRQVLASLGKKVDKKYPHIGGIGVKENWTVLLSKYRIKTNRSIEQLARDTQDAYLKKLSQITFRKGFEKLVNDLKDSGVQVALVTSNAWWIVDEISSELGISKIFKVITTGEEVEYKRPDPDLFLETANKLGIPAEECLVIEDSEAGIEAGERAGMKTIGIARDEKRISSLKSADLIVRDFAELTQSTIAKI